MSGAPPLAQPLVWLSTLVGKIEKLRQHGLVLMLAHSFREDVGKLRLSVNEGRYVDAACNAVTEFVRVAQDVFGMGGV